MPRSLLLLLLLFTFSLHAQIESDIGDVESYEREANPTKLPIYIDLHGKVHFKPLGGSPDVSFGPTVQFGYARTTINYVSPLPFEKFSLDEVWPGQPLIEYRTRRIEYGAGINYSDVFKLGVAPYKGSYESTVTLRQPNEIKRKAGLPQTLQDVEGWSNNDSGSFQTYGGIAIHASFNLGGLRVVAGSIGIQNNFIISLRRVHKDLVTLSLSEEDVKTRGLRIGPSQLNASLTFIKGHLFNSTFELNPSNPFHHELYQKALEGKVIDLQRSLPHSAQRVVWSGKDRQFSFGIPEIAGEEYNWMDFSYGEDMEGLYIKVKRTKGFLTVFREHKTYVYHDKKGVIIVWSSKMKKVSYSALEKKFIKRARILNLNGFEQSRGMPKIGNLIALTGIAITRDELMKLTPATLLEAKEIMKEICQRENLKCQNQRRLDSTFIRLAGNLKKSWPVAKRDLGVSLSAQPALIYSLIKASKWQKEAYVQFLSQKFQSLEGVTPIRL